MDANKEIIKEVKEKNDNLEFEKHKAEIEVESLYKESIEEFKSVIDIKPPCVELLTRLQINGIFAGIIVISYLLGRFRFSFALILAFIYTVSFVFTRRLNRYKKSFKNLIYRTANNKKVRGHFESVEWINNIITKVWHVLEPEISKEIFRTINPILQEKCPPFLSQLRLKNFTLGSYPPFIAGIKHIDEEDAEKIIIDCELGFIPLEVGMDAYSYVNKSNKYQWNSKILMVARFGTKVKNVGVDLPIMVKGISFKGCMRIIITLMHSLDLVKSVEICFMGVPEIDFDLVPLKALDIMDIPGLSAWINTTIETVLKKILVNPNSITIDLTKKTKKTKVQGLLYLYIEKVDFDDNQNGIIEIDVDGRGYFCSRKKEGKKWAVNEFYYIIIENFDEQIQFKISNNNSITTDTFCTGYIDLNLVRKLKYLNRTIPLHSKTNSIGKLHYSLVYTPVEQQFPVKNEQKEIQKIGDVFPNLMTIDKLGYLTECIKVVVKMKIIGIEDLRGRMVDKKKTYDTFFRVIVSPKNIEENTLKPETPKNAFAFVKGTVNATAGFVGGAFATAGSAFGNLVNISERTEAAFLATEKTFHFYESKVIESTNSPLFNQSMEFVVRDYRNDYVYISVLDHNDGSIIGKLTIPTKELKPGLETYKLRNCQSGQIKIAFDIFTEEKRNPKDFIKYEEAAQIEILDLVSIYDHGNFFAVIKNGDKQFISERFHVDELKQPLTIILPLVDDKVMINIYKEGKSDNTYLGECIIENDQKNINKENNKNVAEDDVIEEGINENGVETLRVNTDNEIKSYLLYNDGNENASLRLKFNKQKLQEYKGTSKIPGNYKIVQVRFSEIKGITSQFYIEFYENDVLIHRSFDSENFSIRDVFTFHVGKSEIKAIFKKAEIGKDVILGDCLIPKRKMNENVVLNSTDFTAFIEIEVCGCDFTKKESFNNGTLKTIIKGCSYLPGTDRNGFCDPFIKVFYNQNKIHTTKIKKGMINPVFNENFTMAVNIQTDILRFEVFDWNQFENNEFLAYREVHLFSLKPETREFDLALYDAKTHKKTKAQIRLESQLDPKKERHHEKHEGETIQ